MKNRKWFFSLLILFIACIVVMTGCPATWQLPDDATPEQKQEAMCSDARQGLATGQIGLSVAASKAERKYWQKWLTGAQKALDQYCPE